MSSGSTALAAAKNRRGNGNIIKLTPNGNNSSCSKNNGSCNVPNQRSVDSRDKPVLTPMQVLHMHEMRISKIESQCKSFDTNIQTLTNTTSVQSNVRSGQPIVTTSSASNEEVNILKQRVALLEEMFEHIKEDIFRVQTFAMETNTTLMRVKNTIESSNNNDTNVQQINIVDNEQDDEDEQDNQETEFTVQDIQNLSR
jgi:hypothetical protein